MQLTEQALRHLIAATLILAYIILCAAIGWRTYRRRTAAKQAAAALEATAGNTDKSPVLVAYASQTGQAQSIASQTAALLHAAGLPVRLRSFNEVDAALLAETRQALFIASTYGEGDAPDNAALFLEQPLPQHAAAGGSAPNTTHPASPTPLAHLHYGLLALGDSQYKHFCGFGRAADAWLQKHGAQPWFNRIEADCALPNTTGTANFTNPTPVPPAPTRETTPTTAAPAACDAASTLSTKAALTLWQTHIASSLLNGTWPPPHAEAHGFTELTASTASTDFAPWILLRRQHLNPGSQGGPVWLLEFAPASPTPTVAAWESGDLADIHTPHDEGHARSYSIANIPPATAANMAGTHLNAAQPIQLHLLVRQTRRADGTPGRASHWLTEGMSAGETVALRLRPHPAFRLQDNTHRPLILIGNGTGLAGLRAHLQARARSGAKVNWLIFGERHSCHDHLLATELRQWQTDGILQRVDYAFSRDAPVQRIYVQDRISQAADTLRDWVERQDAAIYVCGSLQGMAQGVDSALRDILGNAQVNLLLKTGRYRRDVY